MEAIAAGDGREVMQFDEEGFSCECRVLFIAVSMCLSSAVVFDAFEFL